MSVSCPDVCDEVIRRLTALGIDVGQDEDHEPIFAGLDQCSLLKTEDVNGLYLIHVFEDVDPEQLGPFESEYVRTQNARRIRRERGDRDGIYVLDIKDGKPEVCSFAGCALDVPYKCKHCGDLLADDEVREHCAGHHPGMGVMDWLSLLNCMELVE